MITVEHDNRELSLSASVRETSDEWLLFMHGWGAAKEGFQEAFDHPEFDKYSICAFDFVGYGQSDKPDNFSYDLADQAKVAESLIRTLNPRRLTIVGHSMGGGIGLLATHALSDIPTTLISAEGNLVPEDTGAIARIIAEQPLTLFKHVGYYSVEALLRFSPSKNNRIWGEWWAAASPHAIHASAQSLVRWSDENTQMALFESLSSKAYVYGDQSSKKKQYVLPRLAQEEVTEIEHSGHFLMFDNPSGFYGAIARVMRG